MSFLFLKIPSKRTFSLSYVMNNLTSDKLCFHFSLQFPLSLHECCVLKRNKIKKMLWSIIKCIKIFKLCTLSYTLPTSDNCELGFSEKIMCWHKILFYPNNVAFGCMNMTAKHEHFSQQRWYWIFCLLSFYIRNCNAKGPKLQLQLCSFSVWTIHRNPVIKLVKSCFILTKNNSQVMQDILSAHLLSLPHRP